MEKNTNTAFKKESYQGKILEYNLDTVLEKYGGHHIDGKQKNSEIGKKYTAHWRDIGTDFWINLESSIHFDYVIETKQGPIFIDCKSTSMTGKCKAKAAIQCSAFKKKFSNCKTYYIYHGLQDKFISTVESLVSAGFLDGYCKDGFEDDILKEVNIIPPKFNKFFNFTK